MFIVGITGGIATGKTTVLSIFKENGIAVIDADQVARKVVEPGTPAWTQIKDYFGSEVFHSDGRINRIVLGYIVFNDIEKRKKLNAITHPLIQKALIRMAFSYFMAGHSYIVIELPLLFETGRMLNFLHKIITVVCEDTQQLSRLCDRDDFQVGYAKKRIDMQMPLEQKTQQSHFVVDNSGLLSYTRQQTEAIIATLNASKFHWYLRASIAGVVMGIFAICVFLPIYFFTS